MIALEDISTIQSTDTIKPIKSIEEGKERFDIVSTVAFLIGVPESHFVSEKTTLMEETFNTLKSDRNAMLIRDISLVRVAIQKNFPKIFQEMQHDLTHMKNLMNTDLIPQDSVARLEKAHINLHPKKDSINDFQIVLNREMLSRIANCKRLFPDWIEWEYIRDLFIVPNGLKEEGIKEAASLYQRNMAPYPYGIYLNWEPNGEGNILYNDWKFMTLLYKHHGKEFTEMRLVRDVSIDTKNRIYDFIDESQKIIFMVDCENSDPYNLCAAIRGLDQEKMAKISKIILYDDINATDTWGMLRDFIRIPIEYVLTRRVKDDKSLVDVKLIVGACRELYKNNVDSFVIVSSDSDYWGLIESLPEARFLVMVEHEKCSGKLKEALRINNIFYCFIDDFFEESEGKSIKKAALMRETTAYFKEYSINLNEMMDHIIARTRVKLTDAEREKFIKETLAKATISVDSDSNMTLEPYRR